MPIAQGFVRHLFAPRAVAIVGASSDPGKISGRTVDYLSHRGFAGRIVPVNPRHRTVQGLPAYPTIGDAPGPIDVAVVAVPAAHVPGAVRACGEAGVPVAVVFASGFGETGENGEPLDDALRAACRDTGIRVVGPNCMGVIGVRDRFAGTFTLALREVGELREGPVALISQSGAFGSFLFAEGQSAGLGFSHFATTGNELDVSAIELARGVLEDDDVRVLLVYLEGIRDGGELVALARRAVELDKPVVVVKAGTSEVGARAAASHTAALSGEDRVYQAVARQVGIVTVNGMQPLLDAGRALSNGRRMRGNRLTILTSSGGAGVLMADLAIAHGLEVPTWSAEWQARLAEFVPAYGATANPIDVTAAMSTRPEIVEQTLAIAAEHPATDAIAVVLGLTAEHTDVLLRTIVEAAGRTDKPIFLTWAGVDDEPIKRLGELGIPAFRDPGRTISAVALVSDWSARRAAEAAAGAAGEAAPNRSGAPVRDRARALLRSQARDGRAQLNEHQSQELLDLYGLAGVRGHVVESADAAVAAADDLGFPVAVKVLSDTIAHKSDIGAVKLSVADAAGVREAVAHVEAAAIAAGEPRPRFLVQAMARPGLELILGILRDATFGSFVLAGIGGVLAELLDDVALRRVPIDRRDAEEMLGSLRAGRLLEGYRGTAYDREAAVAALLGLSRMAEDLGESIASVDINPLIVHESGAVAVDALVVLEDHAGARR